MEKHTLKLIVQIVTMPLLKQKFVTGWRNITKCSGSEAVLRTVLNLKVNTFLNFCYTKWLLHWFVFIHDYTFCKAVNDYYGQQKRVQKYPYNAHNHALEYC